MRSCLAAVLRSEYERVGASSFFFLGLAALKGRCWVVMGDIDAVGAVMCRSVGDVSARRA